MNFASINIICLHDDAPGQERVSNSSEIGSYSNSALKIDKILLVAAIIYILKLFIFSSTGIWLSRSPKYSGILILIYQLPPSPVTLHSPRNQTAGDRKPVHVLICEQVFSCCFLSASGESIIKSYHCRYQ